MTFYCNTCEKYTSWKIEETMKKANLINKEEFGVIWSARKFGQACPQVVSRVKLQT